MNLSGFVQHDILGEIMKLSYGKIFAGIGAVIISSSIWAATSPRQVYRESVHSNLNIEYATDSGRLVGVDYVQFPGMSRPDRRRTEITACGTPVPAGLDVKDGVSVSSVTGCSPEFYMLQQRFERALRENRLKRLLQFSS